MNERASLGTQGTVSLPLSRRDLAEIYEAAIMAGHTRHRDALLAGVNPEFIASLPTEQARGPQLWSDLNLMNDAVILTDGTVPLSTWLANAELLARPRREAKVLAKKYNLLKHRMKGAPAPVSESDAPRRSPAAHTSPPPAVLKTLRRRMALYSYYSWPLFLGVITLMVQSTKGGALAVGVVLSLGTVIILFLCRWVARFSTADATPRIEVYFIWNILEPKLIVIAGDDVLESMQLTLKDLLDFMYEIEIQDPRFPDGLRVAIEKGMFLSSCTIHQGKSELEVKRHVLV